MKKAFGYARTATKKAAKESHSIEIQTKLIKDYCGKNSIELMKVYSDSGKSGIRMNRPALNRLLKQLKETPVNYLVITDFDRLVRDTRQYLTIRNLFKKAGVEILAVNHTPVNTESFDALVDGMLATFNAFHSRIRKMRKARRHYRCKNA